MKIISTLRIKTFAWLVSLGLLLAVGSAVTLSLVAIRQAETVSTTWTEFESKAAQKALLLSQVRRLIGFDGMIHHFKNYVLRKERWRAVAVHERLLHLSIALTAYLSLGIDEEEQAAISGLLSVADEYRSMVPIAEAMAISGATSGEIDEVVRINDSLGIRALETLDQRLTILHQSNKESVQQSVSAITTFSSFSGALLVFVLVLLAGTTIWFAQWRLITPLDKLTRSIKRVNPRAPGTDRLPLSSDIEGTELGALARASNAFLDAVQAHAEMRKRAEIATLDREVHLQTLVENAVDAIITIDTEGRILSFNHAASTVFGYAPGNVIGRNVSMLMPPQEGARHDGYLKNYLETGKAKIIGTGREVQGLRSDGSTFPMRLGVSETRTSEGTTFTGIIRDMTTERESEIRLRIAKQEAERANLAKSEFLSSMSHELRTPMNAILGFTQLMETSPTDPPSPTQREYLRLVLRSGNQLLDLISQVLDLSKIEAGHLEVEHESVQVEELIEECRLSLASRAALLNVSLQPLAPKRSLPALQTDPALLRQVLLNLMSNAVKYNVEGGQVMIDVSETVNKSGDDMLRVIVHDTGTGIPEDRQTDLFTPFNRLGREAGEIEGTGIGLSITKRIMEALGGSIGFRSTPAQGSDFWIDLPLAKTKDREPAPEATKEVSA
ncbi:MAG: PAS domain-containing sensor histidine kinase [Magnetovibrionaceae bacterium]